MPQAAQGSFEKKLYSMYLSYLPKEKIAFDLKMNSDTRGSFTELMKTTEHGQFSVNIKIRRHQGTTLAQHKVGVLHCSGWSWPDTGEKETENLVTIMWANEIFAPNQPDIFGEPL